MTNEAHMMPIRLNLNLSTHAGVHVFLLLSLLDEMLVNLRFSPSPAVSDLPIYTSGLRETK